MIQRAIAEVVGQTFTDDQMKVLVEKYLGIVNPNCPVDEDLFRGIAALCERLFTPYSLEQSENCHACFNDPYKNKERCVKGSFTRLVPNNPDLLFFTLYSAGMHDK